MKTNRKMPKGLPNRLVSGKAGLKPLRVLLGIEAEVRPIRRKIDAFIKGKLKNLRLLSPDLQTPDLRLRFFYELPQERQKLWMHSVNESKTQIPLSLSLEVCAIKNYDESLFQTEMDEDALNDCVDFFEPSAKSNDWQRPALAALPAIHNDLMKWNELPLDRQTHVALAAFSVATILDDIRLLIWAANEIEELAEDFEFALSSSSPDPSVDAHEKEVLLPQFSSETARGREDVEEAFRKVCAALADTAHKLGDNPSDDLLYNNLSSLFDEVAQLREPVLTASVAVQAERLVGEVIEDIRLHTSDVSWLPLSKIHSVWKLTYLAEDQTDVESLQVNAERVKQNLASAVNSLHMVADRITELKQKISEAENAITKDPSLQFSLREQIEEFRTDLADSTAQETQAMYRVLKAALPEGHKYEDQRDYEREWADLQASSIAAAEPTDGRDDVQSEDVEREAPDQEQADQGTSESRLNTVDEDTTSTHQTNVPERPTPVLTGTDELTDNSISNGDTDNAGTRHQSDDTDVLHQKSESSDAPLDLRVLNLWRAIGDDRLGIAYHTARLTPEEDRTSAVFPPADLIAATALGNSVYGPEGEIVKELENHFNAIGDLTRYDTKAQEKAQDALNLLLFSAALRPAIFAPQTGALRILKEVKLLDKFASVSELAHGVVDKVHRFYNVPLDVMRLQEALNKTFIENRFKDYVARVKAWREEARAQRIMFAPAHEVWRRWQLKGEILHDLAELLSNAEEKNRTRIQELQKKLKEPREFQNLVRDTDRNRIGRQTGRNIEARALEQLKNHLKPILDLAQEWLSLMEVKPDQRKFVERAVDELRAAVIQHRDSALAAIEQVQSECPPLPLASALAISHKTIESLTRLFEASEDTDTFGYTENPAAILSKDLLYVTALDIGREYKLIVDRDSNSAIDHLNDLDAHASTLIEAFDARLKRDDLIGANLVCDHMTSIADQDEAHCRAKLKEVVSQRGKKLHNKQSKLIEEVERAYYSGWIDEDVRNDLAARIPQEFSTLESILYNEKEFADIRKHLAQYRTKGAEATRNDLNELTQITSKEKSIVEVAIEEGDFVTAREQIERLNSGEQIVEQSNERGQFDEFQTKRLEIESILDATDRPTYDKIVRAVATCNSVAGLDFSPIAEQDAKQAARLLEIWYKMSKLQYHDVDEDLLREFLELLGFVVKRVSFDSKASVRVEAEPLRDRDLCPLHIFGSAANGQYRILLNWKTPARESLIQSIGTHDYTMVFHFGLLTSDREWLRNWAIQHHKLFLVVDEALVLFLSTVTSGRLHAFFSCTLPFTSAEPFITTSSLVPPEMFYGRAREHNAIIDEYGSCFVYGGRQLGKTALLRSVKDTFHRPEKGNVAIYVDLKVCEIGYARPAEDIWRVLWDELLKVEIVPDSQTQQGQTGHRSWISTLENIIRERNEGRLLVLLDEADEFLKLDAKSDFRESTRLKGLMEETGRKFKVVFAGLHNVLRTTEQANHPLAHLGEPICLGPLLSNGEWQEARSLIRQPLSSVGYQFAGDNLITHILAQTNYYPSLVQLYGTELLRYLRDSSKEVHYKISMEDIDASFRRDGLRQNISDRFRLTLQLDPRYEVIAYAMASELQGEAKNIAQGLDRSQIAEMVRTWWSEGFEIPDVELYVLLHEMEGLGVLRQVKDSARYTLRNPNILLLLGTSDDIEQVLGKQHEMPKIFEPASFHARYKGDEKSPRRGPLSYEQEAQLRRNGGVTVVAGTSAVNIEDIGKFLSGRIESSHQKKEGPLYQKLERFKDVNAFSQHLRKLRPDARQGTHVYLVPLETSWDVHWIEEATNSLDAIKRGPYIRVVFVADSAKLWHILETTEDNRRSDWIYAGPWNHIFLRQWCDDNNLPIDHSKVKDLLDISGGWPFFLEKFYRLLSNNWDTLIEEINNTITEEREEWLKLLGIDSPEIKNQLQALLEYEAFTSEDAKGVEELLSEAKGNSSPDGILNQRLDWAKRLGLLQYSDSWSFNPLVKRLLTKDSG
ncbi:MAG: hypothetical protein OXI58_13240 [Gemmatimonadota bacterium]|nr:hypothetical protein [Gemmatimonadota bacterium]